MNSVKSRKKNRTALRETIDFSSPEALERFRKAAAAFDKRVNRTPETAMRNLIAEGIYTKSGRLSRNYR